MCGPTTKISTRVFTQSRPRPDLRTVLKLPFDAPAKNNAPRPRPKRIQGLQRCERFLFDSSLRRFYVFPVRLSERGQHWRAVAPAEADELSRKSARGFCALSRHRPSDG